MIMITKWILEERIWQDMEMMILPVMVLGTVRQEGEIFLDTRRTLVNMDLETLKLKEETNQHTTMIRNNMEMLLRVETPKNSMKVTRDNMRVTKDNMKVAKNSIMMNNNNIMMARDSIKITKDNIMTLHYLISDQIVPPPLQMKNMVLQTVADPQ